MNQNLLIYARICPTESKFSIQILEMFKKMPNLDIKILDASKPFNSKDEQEYISQFKNIILLFPINWFNLPWNLSRYMAEVWRVGDFNLENKNFYLVVTTGSPQKVYSKEGFGWTIQEYFNNLYSVFKRLKANPVELKYFHNCVNTDENSEEFQNFIREIKDLYINKINK